jgi:serine/threonine protein kinase
MTGRELIKVSDHTAFIADKLLGVGGQGEVWRARTDGVDVAVKLYHPHTATKQQREALERLLARPTPARYFLWPLALVEDRARTTFGYTMALREPRFRALEDFMARRVEPSMHALLTACVQLTDGFLRLHSQGLCYRDISFANVFFDPITGDVRICDLDNVDVAGTPHAGVLGTPRFMAPEVVRRERPPSDHTDRYSLAVLLFLFLYGGHPLDGAREAKIRCLDVPALEKLYGFDPLYIWDPADSSNRPVHGIHDNPLAFQSMYPRSLADLFLRSFTDGLHFPPKRVRESPSGERRSPGPSTRSGCAHAAPRASMTRPTLAPRPRPAGPVTRPSRCRYGSRSTAEPCSSTATRSCAPTTWGTLGMTTRRSARSCKARRTPPYSASRISRRRSGHSSVPDGSIIDVPPGRAAPLLAGNAINFGTARGELRA